MISHEEMRFMPGDIAYEVRDYEKHELMLLSTINAALNWEREGDVKTQLIGLLLELLVRHIHPPKIFENPAPDGMIYEEKGKRKQP